jgi:hypothetical protein
MFGHHKEEDYENVYNGKEHESKFSHEMVAGAASFAAVSVKGIIRSS